MYATCSRGHRHWGLAGAAGGLIVASGERGTELLLTLRSGAVHHGNTWSIPGGAIDTSDADAHAAACREIYEELGLDVAALPVLGSHTFECGGWTYSTSLLAAEAPFALVVDGWETDAVGWFDLESVDRLAADGSLHPGFASSWPALRRLIGEREPA
ncbi:MAG: 8-oxo-dGTP diphosphatase [Propionibacteriaceae bacterium]|jgi:8-oxo-dGTP diphosphatase|nr:8-oxo-dGTP diphosphatase [Propionibacteriaceae bacterium]